MTALPTHPRPCIDTNCHGEHEPAERVALAASLCDERGLHFTKLRRQILELLWENDHPMGAYELIDALTLKISRPVGPPTVYRALEFLMSEGFASKIESLNAFVPCVHPERRNDCLFFICNTCGASTELEDQRFERLISEKAEQIGFHAARRVIEVEGTCTTCVDADVLQSVGER